MRASVLTFYEGEVVASSSTWKIQFSFRISWLPSALLWRPNVTPGSSLVFVCLSLKYSPLYSLLLPFTSTLIFMSTMNDLETAQHFIYMYVISLTQKSSSYLFSLAHRFIFAVRTLRNTGNRFY